MNPLLKGKTPSNSKYFWNSLEKCEAYALRPWTVCFFVVVIVYLLFELIKLCKVSRFYVTNGKVCFCSEFGDSFLIDD